MMKLAKQLGLMLLGVLVYTQVEALELKKSSLFNKAIPGYVDLGEKHNIETKLSMQWGLIFVEVKLDKQGPFRFLLDTGADVNLLSNEMIKLLKLKPLQKRENLFKTGHQSALISTALYEIPQVHLGQAVFKKVPFVATSTASDDFQLLKDLEVVGILGSNLFHEVVLTLDLPNQKIKMSTQNHFQALHQDKFKTKNKIILNENFYIPIIKIGVLEDDSKTEHDFLVDTGYNGFVKMPICFREAEEGAEKEFVDYDLFKEPGTGFQSELQGALVFGEKKIENPLVKYTIGECKEKEWGLIGTRYLQQQTLSIDQQARIVFLH